MSPIRIDDLPSQEQLSAEELLALYGAGVRRPVRLGFETLEGRDMMSVSFPVVPLPPPSAPAAPVVHSRPQDAFQFIQGGSQGALYALDLEGDLHKFTDSAGWRELGTTTGNLGTALAVSRDPGTGMDQIFKQTTDNHVYRFDGVWKDTGRSMMAIQSGQGKLYGLDSQNAFWIYDTAKNTWTATKLTGKSLVVGIDNAGKDEVYLQAINNMVWRYGADGTMLSTGRAMSSITAGQGEVFGIDTTGKVWTWNFKNAVAGWSYTDMIAVEVTVAKLNANAPDLACARKSDGTLFLFNNGNWSQLTGGPAKVTSVKAVQGTLYALDPTGKLWTCNLTTKAWTDTRQIGVQLTLGTDSMGKNEVYLRDSAGRIFASTDNVWKDDSPAYAKGFRMASADHLGSSSGTVFRDANGQPYRIVDDIVQYFYWVNDQGQVIANDQPGFYRLFTSSDRSSTPIFWFQFVTQQDGSEKWFMTAYQSQKPQMGPQPTAPGQAVQAPQPTPQPTPQPAPQPVAQTTPAVPTANPVVRGNNNGMDSVAWSQTDPNTGLTNIRLVQRRNGQMLSDPFVVSESGRQCQEPTVCMNDQGDTVVAWSEFNGTWSVYARIWNSQTHTWSTVFLVSDTTVNCWAPSVAIGDNGSVSIGYTVNLGGNLNVRVGNFGVGGNWLGDMDLGATSAKECRCHLAINNSYLAISFEVQTETWANVSVRVYHAGVLLWSGYMAQDLGWYKGHDLAVNANGNVLIGYERWNMNTADWDICTRAFSVDGKAANEKVIHAHAPNPGLGDVCLTMDRNNGNYVVGYIQDQIAYVRPVWQWETLGQWQSYACNGFFSLTLDISFNFTIFLSQTEQGVNKAYYHLASPTW